MRFIVDSLPYYREYCVIGGCGRCEDSNNFQTCPRFWTKEQVKSRNNLGECRYLKEAEPQTIISQNFR